MKRTLLIPTLLSILFINLSGQELSQPNGLTVNFIASVENVYLNGYPVITALSDAITQKENYHFADIRAQKPFFGWILPANQRNRLQESYQILVSSSRDALLNDKGDLWDSGKVMSNQSTNVLYEGKALEPQKVYYWKVKFWDNHGYESAFSKVGQFKTGNSLQSYSTDRYPIQKKDEYPESLKQPNEFTYLADFGKAAFGRIRVSLFSDNGRDSVTIHLGEILKEGRIDRSPSGSIRYSRYTVMPKQGWNTYLVTIRPDRRNTGSQAVLMPDYIGEVTPFRYCEIENYYHPVKQTDLVRETVFYPFNDYESYFHSSDTILNQIWDLSKYSIKATSFTGIYIDGDRERIPYEGDALINQLSHYCVAREYSIARYSHEYLIQHPTWPTEWILQSVLIAWEDYMYTGNKLSLEQYYNDLKAKTLTALSDNKGFISTKTGKVSPKVLESIHLEGQLRDIVDWPHTGMLGLEKEEVGEIDGYVFTDINTVVNAYHYRALSLMSRIAALLEKSEDSQFYANQAEKLKKNFNKELFDTKKGVYVDGIGTEHASLHANMFPLAFGMVEKKNVKTVMQFIRSRKMACSVFGAQFLLDAVYDSQDAIYGLELLTSTAERSWYHMIRLGSTITLEAWDNKYKPNQDWNHAWGAVPANMIARKLMGIEPLEPGFQKIRIKPQPASLQHATYVHPTIRGDVSVSFTNQENRSFQLEVVIPANSTADIYLPYFSSKQIITMDNQTVNFRREGNFSVVENVGSGKWSFSVERPRN